MQRLLQESEHPEVRAAAAKALGTVEGMEPGIDGELDTWLMLLASQPQTWNLLLRDKQSMEHGRGQKG